MYLYHIVIILQRLDEQGEPALIQMNHAAHSSFFPGTVEQYEKFSEAYRAFYKIIYEYSITIKSSPGQCAERII